jgi:hypothetical protein
MELVPDSCDEKWRFWAYCFFFEALPDEETNSSCKVHCKVFFEKKVCVSQHSDSIALTRLKAMSRIGTGWLIMSFRITL